MIQTPAHGQGKQGKKGNLILNSKKYGKQGKERKPHFEFIGDTDTGALICDALRALTLESYFESYFEEYS